LRCGAVGISPNHAPVVARSNPELVQLPNNVSTLELLLEATQEAWESLDIDLFKHLSETMPHRVADVVKYNGWHTSY
jgi:hypothetical protein